MVPIIGFVFPAEVPALGFVRLEYQSGATIPIAQDNGGLPSRAVPLTEELVRVLIIDQKEIGGPNIFRNRDGLGIEVADFKRIGGAGPVVRQCLPDREKEDSRPEDPDRPTEPGNLRFQLGRLFGLGHLTGILADRVHRV
jgi:hypothetical protein